MKEELLKLTIKTLSNAAVDIIRIKGVENAKNDIIKLSEALELIANLYDLNMDIYSCFAQSVLNKILYDEDYIISWDFK